MANYELDVPNTPETKFRIASVTKQFTAMAIVQLQEMGLLNVNDSISKYIPDYPRGDEIIILHLLNHKSGIPNMSLSSEKAKFPISLKKLVDLFKNKPLEFTPGEKFEYSNAGYALLAYIIEKVSGKTYEEFLRENIFKPLGMINSGYDHHEVILKNRASGYRAGPYNVDYVDMSTNKGAGGLYSTVKDLYLWDRALYTGKVARKDSINKIVRSMKKDPIKDEYSYGWVLDDFFGRTGMWHNGATTGFRSFIIRFINDDICIIALSNIEFSRIEKICIDIAAIIFGKKYEMPKKRVAIKVDPKVYDTYVGRYELKPDFILSITKEEDQLFVQATGQGKIAIFPESETKFFCKDVDAQISFVKDKDGKVTKLILHQGGRDQEAKKIK